MSFNIRNKSLIVSLIVIFLVNAISTAQEKTDKKEIKIGIIDGAPLGFIDQDGKIKGFYVDLTNEIAKREHWETQLFLEPVNNLLNKLKNNEIDIILGMSYSEERSGWVDFSSVVMLTGWCQLYSGKENINSLTDLAGKKTGVVKSSVTFSKFTGLINSLNINTKITEYTSENSVFEALSKGEVDAGVVSSIYGYNHEKDYKVSPSNIVFEPYGHYAATNQGKNEIMLQTIDLYIRQWKSDKKSIYYQSFEHWIHRDYNMIVVPVWVWRLIGLILSILAIVTLIAFILRRSVARATVQLRQSNKILTEEIEKRRETEEALRKSEEKYRYLTELSPDLIWTADLTGKVNYISQAIKHVRGYTPEEYLKLPPEKIYTPRTQKLLDQTLQSELKKILSGDVDRNHSVAIETEHLKRDGTPSWSELHIRAIFDERGNVTGLMGISRDIHERKIAELQLRESEEKFLQFAENIDDIVWLEDEKGNVLFVNKAIETVFKISKSTVMANTNIITRFLSQSDAGRFEKNLVNEELNTSYSTDYQVTLPDGTRRWIWLKRFPIFNDQGNLYRRAGIASDITVLKEAQLELVKATEKAQESDRLKTIFLNNITHEIRTPINGIMGFGQLLSENPQTTDEQKMFLDVIINSAKRLVNVVDDLLDISKIESGELKITLSSISLPELTEEICQNAKAILANEKRSDKVSITVHPDKSIDYIYVDGNRLKQILNNLISNAIKFTTDGEISIGYKIFKAQHYIEFYVKDTGIGIPDNKLESIFERFRQGDETYARSFEGTGLGLAISKGLVEMMNGKMMVQSELHKGSTFYFSIPYQEGKFSDHDKKEKKAEYQWDKKKILIVEDDQNSFFFINTVLTKTKAIILHAKNGKHALELVSKNPDLDLILMDIRLPDIDGFELTKTIRKSNPNVKIIAQTAFTFNNDREKCLDAGCNDYMAKPLSILQILEVVARNLG